MTLSEGGKEGLLWHKENFEPMININQEFKSGWLPSEPIKTSQSPGSFCLSEVGGRLSWLPSGNAKNPVGLYGLTHSFQERTEQERLAFLASRWVNSCHPYTELHLTYSVKLPSNALACFHEWGQLSQPRCDERVAGSSSLQGVPGTLKVCLLFWSCPPFSNLCDMVQNLCWKFISYETLAF